IGPSLDGQFHQGNFGIVTAAGFELLPKSDADVALIARVGRDEDLPAVVEALAGLRRQGAIVRVAHVANRERSWISLAPLLVQELQTLQAIPAAAHPREVAEEFLRREGFGPWSVVAAVPGRGARQRWARREIRRSLRGLARLSFLSDAQFRGAEKLLSHLIVHPWFRRKLALLRAVMPLHHLALGIPTDATIQGVYWPVSEAHPANGSNPDLSQAGLLYCLPLLPADAENVRACIEGTREIFKRYGFEPALTVNLLDDRSLEGVFSLAFARADARQVEAARACIREAEAFYIRSGWPPYRVGIESMDLIVDPEKPYWKTVRDLKKVFDPNEIIAPGRYNLS
ncbi:MAG: FAD-binding oxidoreductase, partial [Kiritimatiellia bacterium]|nr:FAD-binding oxidoreductase [Kiritimatiellia bacterium]